MEHLRKITARTVGLAKLKAGQSFTLYGKVRRFETGTSDYGNFVKFRGTFEAVNEITGSAYGASVAIFPGGLLEDELMEAVEAATGPVDVAIRFSMVEDDKSTTGVAWKAERLIESAEADPLADLRAKVFGSLPSPGESEADDE